MAITPGRGNRIFVTEKAFLDTVMKVKDRCSSIEHVIVVDEPVEGTLSLGDVQARRVRTPIQLDGMTGPETFELVGARLWSTGVGVHQVNWEWQSREGPGSPDDLSALVRAAGGTPDDRAMGDVEGGMRYLRALPYANGKVGVIGFCSGGRQTYIAACKLKGIDAAVDCWGGRVVAKPEELTPRQPVAPIDMTPEMSAPLLGIFGKDDPNPSPEQVAIIEQELRRLGKTYEFHSYEGAGHGFFAVDRPGYRSMQATDAWQKVFAWYEKYLKG